MNASHRSSTQARCSGFTPVPSAPGLTIANRTFLAGTPASQLPDWIARLGEAGLADFTDKNQDGVISAAELLVSRDVFEAASLSQSEAEYQQFQLRGVEKAVKALPLERASHLQKIILHWNDGTGHTQTWDNINAASYNPSHGIGSYAEGT